jgi:hypothetical protein
MELQLKIIGFLLMALSLVHIVFPGYFNWKNELSTLSLINRQMIYVHTLFIALIIFMMGALCLLCSYEMVSTQLGRYVSLGLAVFWFIRLLVQFFGYSSKLWKGRKFETTVHVIFTMLWSYFSIVFAMIYFD